MNVHVLQHVPFEGIGSIETWLAARNAAVTRTEFYRSAQFPEVAALDLIIATGGPMSVNDEAELPWLVAEKRFLREAMDAGVAVLGICLGAQLIASALGSRVYPGPEREIGWFEIEAVKGGGAAFEFPERLRVFHWHGETFDLPSGAVRLARTEVCENQAFQFGDRVIGLQFHLETTPESAQGMVKHCGHELTGGRFVRSAAEILGEPEETYSACQGVVDDILGFLLVLEV